MGFLVIHSRCVLHRPLMQPARGAPWPLWCNTPVDALGEQVPHWAPPLLLHPLPEMSTGQKSLGFVPKPVHAHLVFMVTELLWILGRPREETAHPQVRSTLPLLRSVTQGSDPTKSAGSNSACPTGGTGRVRKMGRRGEPRYSLSRGHLHSGRVSSVAPANAELFYRDPSPTRGPWQPLPSLSSS